MRMVGAWVACALALVASGCATLTGTIAASTGQWPTTTSLEYETWRGDAPAAALVVEARLESPPRAICEERRFEPAVRVMHEAIGFSAGGRIAYGFIGLSELALASALAFLPRSEGDDHAVLDVSATIIGLDGIATVLLAFLIPDTHRRWETEGPAREHTSYMCPPDVAFEAAGHAFPVMPDGTLSAVDGRSLMEAVVETGEPVALRFRGETRWTTVPPDVRCAWANEVGSRLAPAVCPLPPRFGRAL